MALEVPKYTVGPGPHWRSATSVTQMNYTFLVALLPAAFLGSVAQAFGPNAAALNAGSGPLATIMEVLVKELGVNAGLLWLISNMGMLALAMGLGMLVEYSCQVVMRQPYHATNGHGALMGLILAMLMPPTVPVWVLVFGIIITIVVGKQIFGGMGGYPIHPAIVGWLVLLLSWPNHLYPVGMDSIAAAHFAAIAATIAGGLALVGLGHIRWPIPASVLLGVLLGFFLLQGDLQGGLYEQLFTGHVFLAAFFLAPDSTSSPVNRAAMWIYGLGMGFLIILIRAYGIWPDAVPFAVMLMNIMHPLLDRIRPAVKKVRTENG